jgi:hypothetical protein
MIYFGFGLWSLGAASTIHILQLKHCWPFYFLNYAEKQLIKPGEFFFTYKVKNEPSANAVMREILWAIYGYW